MNGDPSATKRRSWGLLGTAAVHAVLAWLFLTAQFAPVQRPEEPDQPAVFALSPPPPPPPQSEWTPPPDRPPAPAAAKRLSPATAGGGGAPPPGRAAARPAREATPSQPSIIPFDAPAASPTSSFAGLGAAPALAGTADVGGVGTGAGSGIGSGSGTGSGAGHGDGAGDGDGAGARYGRAVWIRRPTNAEFARYFPKRARYDGVRGEVKLSCRLRRSGQPRRCTVVSELPLGYGFGAAAVAMSHTFRIRHVLRNGERTEIPVLVPVTFDIAGRD